MKILITGVAGFIGFHAAKKLIKNYQIIGIDNLNNYYDPELKKARLDELLKLGLEFKEADSSNSYGISLYMLGRAYDFNKQYKEAVENYTSANKFFPSKTNKDIYQKAVLNINLGISLSFIDKDKSKKLLLENLSIFKKKDISEYISTAIKNRIKEAEAILKTLSK